MGMRRERGGEGGERGEGREVVCKEEKWWQWGQKVREGGKCQEQMERSDGEDRRRELEGGACAYFVEFSKTEFASFQEIRFYRENKFEVDQLVSKLYILQPTPSVYITTQLLFQMYRMEGHYI